MQGPFTEVFRRGPFARPRGWAVFAQIPTTNETSVTYDGFTWTFDQAMPVGYFEDGSPFVVSTSAFLLVSVTPISAVVDGAVAHGLGKDFYSTTTQPFDEFIGQGSSSFLVAAKTTYSGNIDPGATGSPVSVAMGEQCSFVKAKRLSAVTTAESWQTIEKYGVLTVLSEAPLEGSYRPGIAALTKTMLNKNDLNASALRSLSLSASFTTTIADAIADVPTDCLGVFGHNGEKRRRFRTDEARIGDNYSAIVAPAYARALIYLHRSDLSEAQRDDLLALVAVHASDLAGVISRGFGAEATRGNGAGQAGAMQPFLFAAAFLFNSSTMLTAACALDSNMLATSIWIDNDDVGIAANGKSGRAGQTYFSEQIGLPWIVPDEETSAVTGRYLAIGGSIMSYEIPCVALFQNGPGGVSGLTAMLDGANDNTNPKAAAIAFMSRYRTWEPSALSAYNPTDEAKDLHDQVAGLVAGYEWSGPPEQLPMGDAAAFNDDYFGAAAGGVTYDFTAMTGFATEAITQYDLRYSLDGRQWIESNNVGASGTVTPLLRGQAHYMQGRRRSASGTAPWSANHPYALPYTGTIRGRPTTTGTETNAAPVNTVAPVIVRRLYPLWDWPDWEPAPDPLASFIEELAIGVGYWTGFPAPTYTYSWERNGTPVSTSATRIIKFQDAGTDLVGKVTATNSSGAVTEATAAITVPSAASTEYERVDNGGQAYFFRAGGFETPPSGKTLTFAVKGRLLSGDAAFRNIIIQHTSAQPLLAQFRATTDLCRVSARNSSGTEILRVDSAASLFTVALGEFTYVVSVDLATGTVHRYLYSGGSWSVTSSGTDVLTNDNINWSAVTNIGVLGESRGTQIADMELDYVFLHPTYLDLSVLATRDQFLTTSGMGADGSGPLGGSAPLLFVTGPESLIEAGIANRGEAGGTFLPRTALVGTVATTSGSAIVTGTGTTFTNLQGGDKIVFSNGVTTEYTVSEVISETSLELASNAAITASGLTLSKVTITGFGGFTDV